MAEEITEDQAQEALQQLIPMEDEAEESTAPAAAPVEKEEPPAEETTTLEAGTEKEVPPEEAPSEEEAAAPEEPDVVLQEAEKRYEAKLQAIQQRNSENVKILQDRYLRKSTSADKALKILEATLTEDGVQPDDVKRVISEMKGTMHPASSSYSPPIPAPQGMEDQALVLNSFLNEKGMTQDDANEFGNWVRTEAGDAMTAAEQAVAGQSLDGFLRLAHTRWQEGLSAKDKQTKRDDAVGAVRSVKRAQRAAARAASAKPTAPRKQPAGPKTETAMPKNDAEVAELVRRSVEQYR